MTTYDFNRVIDRTGSGDLKHSVLAARWGRTDLLPLWVADMDFATPPFVLNALRRRLEPNAILGYTVTPEELWQAVMAWIATHHQWQVEREWLSFIPGIVKGIGFVINVFTQPGDKVIIQPPVYHPFRITPEANGREVVCNPLRLNSDGIYEMDFENLAQVCDEHCRVLILCNPHNPAGVCWSREMLQQLAAFCAEHHVLVISDEIHCDLALFGNKHVPFATVSEQARDISITFGAPTKTFNMAGIVSSYAIVPNKALRERFYGWLRANELEEPTMFAPVATIAAYNQGESWRKQMLAYVEANIRFVEDYCRERLPQIHPMRPQAGFLVWLDCRALQLNHEQLLDLFIDKAHLALNDGEMFGSGGEGFMRLNIATPRVVLQQALQQLEAAVAGL